MWTTIDEPWWGSRPVAVIGGGPSLKAALSDVEAGLSRIRGKAHVLAVKGAVFDIPWADAGFGIDTSDMETWWGRLSGVTYPVWWALPERYKTPHSEAPHCLRLIRRVHGTKIPTDPGCICSGGTSGFAAIPFAVMKGARRIVLFGLDYAPGADGEWYWSDGHYTRGMPGANNWKRWAGVFRDLVPQLRERGVRVVNASPASEIDAFPRVTVEDGLRLIEGTVPWPV